MNNAHPLVKRNALTMGNLRAAAPTATPRLAPTSRPSPRGPPAGLHAIAKAAPPKPAQPHDHAIGYARRSWLANHKWTAGAVAGFFVIAASGITASLLVRQDIATTPAAVAPVVKFLSGTDYAAINAAGFATLTIGTSGASATLALNGVAGAALTSLTNLAKIQNTDAQAYTVGFARSTTLNAAITDFTITVKNGGSTILTWNAVSAASSSTFSLPASTTYDINIQLSVADGTTVGSLGSFTMQVSIT
jgi:hypothetical protein